MRTKPYSERGISRVPCARCGDPSWFQWSFSPCAENNRIRHVGVCMPCDVILNALYLFLFHDPKAREMIAAYRERIGEHELTDLDIDLLEQAVDRIP